MGMKLFIALALAVAVGLALGLSPYASSSPDGLEKVATDKGFVEDGTLHSIQEDSPIPDYAFPGIDNPRLATAVAGFVGTLMVFFIGYAIAWLLQRRRTPAQSEPGAPAGAA